MDKPIRYINASLRFFKEGEHHVTRFCEDDVLLLVYSGVLRFSENGEQKEISAGEYYIQRHGMYQYLYIHFLAENWATEGEILPKRGKFEYSALKADMEEMNRLSHGGAPYIAKAGKLYNILTALGAKRSVPSPADDISAYIAKNRGGEITLSVLCEEFHFSKNHIINIFKKTSICPETVL